MGQPTCLADPSSQFHPLDTLGLISNLDVDLGSQPAPMSRPVATFAQVALDLGMPAQLLIQRQLVGMGHLALPVDMQNVRQIDSNVEY